MRSKKRLASSVSGNGSFNENYAEFAKQYKETKEGAAQKRFLQEKYGEIFNSRVPPQSRTLIKAKISYSLLVEGYRKNNIPVPEKIMNNYKAAQEFNIKGFNSSMERLLIAEMAEEKKEDSMATKKVVKVVKKKSSPAPALTKAVKGKKEPRITVSGIFRGIFEGNYTKKLSDNQIAKEVNAKTKDVSRGKTYVGKDVPAVRRKFNLGLLSEQSGKPKKKLEKFDDKK